MSSKYEFVEVLGKGNFGEVKLVRHKKEGELYAMKEINLAHVNEGTLHSLIAEVSALASFDSRYVTRHKESLIDDGHLLIVLEYCECGDLRTLLHTAKEREQRLEIDQVLDWMAQLAIAMRHIHERGVMHRDLKPENVFLTRDGQLKMSDLGLSCVLSDTRTTARESVGTPFFFSPEIVQGFPYGFGNDIWSLGIMFYQLCTLDVPFKAGSYSSLFEKLIHKKAKKLPKPYRQACGKLVMSMLSKDPTDRPNIDEVCNHASIRDRVKKFENAKKKKGDAAGERGVYDGEEGAFPILADRCVDLRKAREKKERDEGSDSNELKFEKERPRKGRASKVLIQKLEMTQKWAREGISKSQRPRRKFDPTMVDTSPEELKVFRDKFIVKRKGGKARDSKASTDIYKMKIPLVADSAYSSGTGTGSKSYSNTHSGSYSSAASTAYGSYSGAYSPAASSSNNSAGKRGKGKSERGAKESERGKAKGKAKKKKPASKASGKKDAKRGKR